MLEVKNLVKIYKTGKEEVRALDDVSINFPENGLVFLPFCTFIKVILNSLLISL